MSRNLVAFMPAELIDNTGYFSRFGILQQLYNFDGTKIPDGKGDFWLIGMKMDDAETYYKAWTWEKTLTQIKNTAWTVINAATFDNAQISTHLRAVQSPNGKIWVIR